MSASSQLDYEPGVSRVLQSKTETKSFYNKIAAVYDLLSESTEQPVREAGLAMLAAALGETVLEVGCGTGHSLVALAKSVGPKGKVVGIDLAENMIAKSHELAQKEGVADRVELHCGDAEHLPFNSASFDALFTSFTLELFDTPELPKVLTEWKRVLCPGGRLVIVAVSKEGKQNLVVRVFEWTHRHFPNLLDCRPIYVRRALEAVGFEIADARIDQMWVPVEIVQGIKNIC